MRLFEHGNFCWHELMTSDVAAAKRFCGELFGWSAEEIEMPQGVYVMFRLGDREVAGGMQIPPEWGEGAPPHWGCYVAVDDVDQTLAHAQQLGGQTCMPPVDVPGKGRLAGLADPQGAMVNLWSEKAQPDAPHQPPGPGAFCWDELLAKDSGAAAAFYGPLFRWTSALQQMPSGPYTLFQRGDAMLAGMMEITPAMGPVPTHWMPYVMVTACDDTASRAVELGATIVVPPMDIPTIGRFAVIADPQGAHVSVITFQS